MSLYPPEVHASLPALPRGPSSKVYFVDAANGDDGNSGDRYSKPLATIAEAYDRCVANQHDVVAYIAGASGINLSAALTWSKSYTHLVGLCAPSHVGQRSRIFQLSTLTGASPLLTVSGSGCIFQDFYIFQGVNDATSLVNVSVTGSRNYFNNVHFAGGGHLTQAVDGGASLLISGGSENLFERCTVGVDTVAAGNGMAGLVFAATGGAARNKFRDCHFSMHAGHAGAIFVEALGNSGIDRYQVFERCLFTNLAAQAMTQAFAIAAGFDPANKRMLLKDCVLIGAGKWDNGDTGLVYGNMNAVTGADASGALVEMIT